MNSNSSNHPMNTTDESDEIRLLDLWRIIARRWKMILLLFLAITLGTLVLSLLWPKSYQAITSIIPLETSPTSLSTAMAALGGLTGISLGTSTTSDKLVAVLESRTVGENVIKGVNLLSELKPGLLARFLGLITGSVKPVTIEDGLRNLEDIADITSDPKSNLITIAVEHRISGRSAQIANAYVEQLDRFMNKNAFTLSKKKRILLENQIVQSKDQLKIAEDKLKDYSQDKKILAPEVQAEAAIKGLSDLKAEIVSKEVQLGVLRSYATLQNPEVQTIQDQVNMLKRQLAKIEEGGGIPGGGSELSLAGAPQLALSFERYKRDVEFYGKLLELLLPQYEMAKMEEAKEDISFQVIDQAVAPIMNYKPKILLNLILAGAFSIFLGVFIAFFLNYREKIKSQPASFPL